MKCDEILYKLAPFGDYDMDCETCQFYMAEGNMTKGGDCKLHNVK